jgi:Tfp pilus assembly protein FimT
VEHALLKRDGMPPRLSARSRSACSSSAGYSLIELLVLLALVMVLSAMAGLQVIQARPVLEGDSAMRVVLAQVRLAREQAISQRRFVEVAFIPDAVVRTVREDVPGPSKTILGTVGVERGFTFQLVNRVPDTPDGFGNPAAVSFGTASTIRFTPDGTLVNENGATLNGSVFLARAGEARSARAITVLGATGRIRAYRWNGRAWDLV